jgi:hypothetical protein
MTRCKPYHNRDFIAARKAIKRRMYELMYDLTRSPSTPAGRMRGGVDGKFPPNALRAFLDMELDRLPLLLLLLPLFQAANRVAHAMRSVVPLRPAQGIVDHVWPYLALCLVLESLHDGHLVSARTEKP